MIEQRLHLNAGSLTVPEQIWAVQNDSGRSLRLYLRDLSVLSGVTGQLTFVLPDGSRNSVLATPVISENAFVVENMAPLLVLPGVTRCQLKVTSNEKLVSTSMFEVHVQKKVSN